MGKWINYKEQKPPYGVEVLAYHHEWVNEYFNPKGIRVGFLQDSLSEDAKSLIKHDTFTITGFVTHPNYLRNSGSNYAVVPNSTFDMENNNNYYLAAMAKADYGSDLDIFSDDYFNYINKIQLDLEKELDDLKIEHTLEVKAAAEKKLEDKKEEADKEISDAQDKIDDGRNEYDRKIKEGEASLNDARSKISYYEGYIDRGEEDLNMMNSIYNSDVVPMKDKINGLEEKYDEYEAKENETELLSKDRSR